MTQNENLRNERKSKKKENKKKTKKQNKNKNKTKTKRNKTKQKERIEWGVIGLIGTNVGEYVAGAFFCLDAIEKLIEKTRSEEVSEITVKVFFLEMIKVIKNRVKT